MSEKYLVGLDFGTLSGRAIVVRASDGREMGSAVTEYRHGVMDRTLIAGDNRELPLEFALQVPSDYEEVLATAIPNAIENAGIDPKAIVGVGIDATSATVFVTDKDGRPLAEREEFKNNPHAYIKLWKHHGAQKQADRIVSLAESRNENWLSRYGGVLSSELLLPKVLELFEEAPEVYEATDVIVDLVDWATWRLTGKLSFSAGDSGYKRMYQDGAYPSREFLEELAPGFGSVFEEKMAGDIIPLGAKAGEITAEIAEITGIPQGTPVASGNIDAHVVVAGANAVATGQLTSILGTSTCHIISNEQCLPVPGVFGIVDGGAVDGLWGYEAGQTAVGDIFAWFANTHTPAEYKKKAESEGKSVLEYLTDLASQQKIGEHGLVALDWFNGNRSPLSDSNLSGLIIGQTLTTKPEDTYRALVESTIFGARVIIENFERHGVKVEEIVAAGGLLKNTFYMQTLADVTRRRISISEAEQTGALGATVFAAVAAGVYENVGDAAQAMSNVRKDAYVPNEENSKKYDELFAVYKELFEYFSRKSASPMHQLKAIKARTHKDN